MSVSSLPVVVLWCIGVCAGLAIILPLLLTILGLSRYRNRIDENPDSLEPGDSDLSYASTYQQLTELGFRPLGTCHETIRFFGPRWSWSNLLGVFGSHQHSSFACVYRLYPDDPVCAAFATCFEDGAQIWTANHAHHLKIKEPDYVRSGIPTTDLAYVLDEHLKAVESFIADGHAADVSASLSVLAASLAHHTPRAIRRRKPQWTQMLWLWLFLLLGPPAFFAFGTRQLWLLPAGMIVVAAFIHWFYRRARRQEALRHRHYLALSGIARHVALSGYMEPQPRAQGPSSEAVMANPPPDCSRRN